MRIEMKICSSIFYYYASAINTSVLSTYYYLTYFNQDFLCTKSFLLYHYYQLTKQCIDFKLFFFFMSLSWSVYLQKGITRFNCFLSRLKKQDYMAKKIYKFNLKTCKDKMLYFPVLLFLYLYSILIGLIFFFFVK